LLLGVLWVVIAVVVLKFNNASVVTVGILTGIMFLVFAAEEFALAALDRSARCIWALFGVLLTAAGIVALIHPRGGMRSLRQPVTARPTSGRSSSATRSGWCSSAPVINLRGSVPWMPRICKVNGIAVMGHRDGTVLDRTVSDGAQDPRHVDTIEPLWNLFDPTPEGCPANWYEQFC
jgi:hypothetical protein